MNKPTAKKMNYTLDITRRIPVTEATRDGGTEEKSKTLKGTFVKLNPTMFAFVEEAKTTIIEITKDTRGCACKTFTDSNLSLMCEHLIAFDDLKEPPQLMIYNDQKICRVLTEYLFTLGWSVEPDHWLYPSLDSPTRSVDATSDSGGDNSTSNVSLSHDSENIKKTVHWKCPNCGEEFDVEEDDLNNFILNHIDVCKGKPASKKKTPTTNDLPKTTKSVDATSDPEGESNEGDDPTPDNPPKRPPTPDVPKTDTTENDEPTMNEPPSIGAATVSINPGSIVHIARAMCEVQKTELFAILNADNPFTHSRYADLPSIWTVIRKPLTDNGLSVIQTTEPYPGGVTVVTTLMHVSGETLTTKLSEKVPERLPDKNGQERSNIQDLGSTITYLRRYSLVGLIGVSPADDDGELAMGRGR